MKEQTQRLLPAILFTFLISTCHGFTINSNPGSLSVAKSSTRSSSSSSSSQSCLFRHQKIISCNNINGKKNNGLQFLSSLRMTSSSNDKDKETEVVSSGEESIKETNAKASSTAETATKTTTAASSKERSGFLTALLLAPPLIAKFGIVLLVKVATDLVVFPLLFLYRICKIVKMKLFSLFGIVAGKSSGSSTPGIDASGVNGVNGDKAIMKGDQINGAT